MSLPMRKIRQQQLPSRVGETWKGTRRAPRYCCVDGLAPHWPRESKCIVPQPASHNPEMLLWEWTGLSEGKCEWTAKGTILSRQRKH